ncbi:MAG TPA: type II CAAX endopeptidase family protein [Dongiaceae bacterium]|nr:type II CAAX endopeptidase family protein [Dongiaceae bacterium]
MNPFEENPKAGDNPLPPKDDSRDSPDESLDDLASRIVIHSVAPEPGLSVSSSELPLTPAPPPAPWYAFLPEDLRVSWSWLHFLGFFIFAFGSLIVLQAAVFIYLAGGRKLSQAQLEQLVQEHALLMVGLNVALFFLIMIFLYVTVGVLRDAPFWRTIGWRPLPRDGRAPSNVWVYLLCGVGLAICVGLGTAVMKTPTDLPIEKMFKGRASAIALMAMAVFVAPLVEETVFRGYLYPLFAGHLSRLARSFGQSDQEAVHTGMWISIVLTGFLFGSLHGAQLGWTWSIVLLLVTVGMVFTYARARSGTVLASFLLHLAYNSTIALVSLAATRGFTRMPPHP